MQKPVMGSNRLHNRPTVCSLANGTDERVLALRRDRCGTVRTPVCVQQPLAQYRICRNPLITASEGDDALSEADVVISCAGLLFAGNETTTNLIGNGLLAFLRHPDQLERLRDAPTLIESAVEEMLRYDSPVQLTARIAKEDVEIGGKRVGVGQRVVLFLGAANRDPAQFAAADRFDVGRQENHHLSFSHGAHFCLGAALARLEGQIAIGTMLRRLPNLRLEAESLEWRDNKNLRGLRALPVTFG